MENLQIKSHIIISEQSLDSVLPLLASIDWHERLIAI